MNMNKLLLIGFLIAFVIMGALTMQRSMPSHKEERIYNALKVYMPYKLDKYVGGLAIVDSRDGRKEKPSAQEVLLRLDELEREWGREYLKVEGDHVIILGENNQSVARVFIESPQERDFLKKFFGI